MGSIISLKNIHKKYKSISALDGVGFEVERGTVFGLLGPNGAGKTTTIRILTGLTKPDSGMASILNIDIIKNSVQVKQRIGVVPESSNVYDEMTARDNLVFASELYGVPGKERKKRADDLLELFSLTDRAGDTVLGLSRGMKRRLTIACALVHQPEILFLDEPTTGLDVQSAIILRNQIRSLNKKGTTVLLTTHYLEEADQLCDRIAMINHGKIVAIDHPENLKTQVTGSKIIEVAFNEPLDVRDFSTIEGVVETQKIGDKFRLTISNSKDIIGEITDFARKKHRIITTINTLKPSLEDAFLKITGVDPEEVKKEKETPKPRRNDG